MFGSNTCNIVTTNISTLDPMIGTTSFHRRCENVELSAYKPTICSPRPVGENVPLVDSVPVRRRTGRVESSMSSNNSHQTGRERDATTGISRSPTVSSRLFPSRYITIHNFISGIFAQITFEYILPQN